MKSVLFFFFFFGLSLSLILASPVFAAPSASEIAVSNKSRPADDIKADERRHPKELLDFSKVKMGDKVVDVLPGRGYFTRLFAGVVGPKGRVVAFVPKELEGASFKPVEAAKDAVKGMKNAEVLVSPVAKIGAEKVDVVWTSQNYHDLKIKKLIDVDMAALNKQVFNMLKPGGFYVVIDHVAAAGAGEADIEQLHRIDPALVKKEIEAAGFVFQEESKVLAQNEDHKLNVFDPAIRGKTDQFAYRFVKPKK
jgi:predicted methyltransferase